MKRLLTVLGITHFLAFLLPIVGFALAVGPLVANPPIELGPFMFTCDKDHVADITGCFWTWQ